MEYEANTNRANNFPSQVSVRLEVSPPAKLHLFKVSVVQIVKVGASLRLKIIHVRNSNQVEILSITGRSYVHHRVVPLGSTMM